MVKTIKIDCASPDTSNEPNWLKLPSELLNLVFERLGFADFQRVKSVCSYWLSTSKQSTSNIQNHLLILLPKKGNDYCLLCNPEEKYKLYRIQDLGDSFANNNCLAIYGSWLVMQDPQSNFYIMNLFTRERIDMPSLESQLGSIEIKINKFDNHLLVIYFREKNMFVSYNCSNNKHNYLDLLYLWIDDKSKDYVFIWTSQKGVLFYTRKGEKFWKQIKCENLIDMVYNDAKLYLYRFNHDIEVFDISGDIPYQIIYDAKIPHMEIDLGDAQRIKRSKLVVTLTGEILRVTYKILSDDDDWSFSIHKLDSSSNQWESVTCLGDEAILMDLGITMNANSIEGVNRNSIYFSGLRYFHTQLDKYVWSKEDIFIFNLDTHKVERLDPSIYSDFPISNARWFVTNMKHK